MWKVQLFKLNFDDLETEAAAATVAGGWLTMGERVESFESSFAKLLGEPSARCTAVANGTAALHMAILALGVQPGDEVILAGLTFVADANVVRIAGAIPVLADSTSLDDWNVSAQTIQSRLTPKTKAVMVVHYAGYPCDMFSIVELCRGRGIGLIEDAAHAPGASIGNRGCGTFGDIGCFSFFSNKNLSVGEGGMVVTRDENLHRCLRHLRSHGMSTLTLDRHKGRAITYDVEEPGLNYRMDEIRAAIGLVQLDKLSQGNARRGELTHRYRHRLANSPVSVPFAKLRDGVKPAYHILPVLLPESCDRISVIEHLKSKGVQSSIHYPPFWSFKAYRDMFRPEDTPVAAEISRRELTLPLYPTMRDEDVDYVTECLLEALT